MSVTQEAFISSKILKWARERVGATKHEIAESVNVNPRKIDAWEDGSARPTFRQAQHLALALHIPFGYLFLSNPPDIKVEIPDLRTVDGVFRGEPSPEFADTLNSVMLRQEWYKDFLRQTGTAEELPFVGRFNIQTPVQEVAAAIADTVGISPEFRIQANTWEEFLRFFARRLENLGILVFRNGIVGNNTRRKLSVGEFRGFVICDPIAPAIFINSQDAKSAQIFTLAHELVHIWIGESGISNPDFERRSSEQANQIERFCNRAAAEILIPRDEFNARWNPDDSILRNLHRLSYEFKVSTVTVLIQAFDSRRINQAEYANQLRREMSKWVQAEGEEGGGGDFYNVLRARNGRTFLETLVSAAINGQIPRREAASLLGVRTQTIANIAEEIFK